MADLLVKYKPSLKPGINCDLIVYKDWIKENTDVRRAIIYDIEGNSLILSQTNPPLSTRYLGKYIQVTFLDKGKDGPDRYGLEAKFTKILRDYQLYSTNTVRAVVMVTPDISKIDGNYDLRMFFRVKPDPDSGIKVSINRRPVTIIDFSVGGLCYSRAVDPSLQAGQVVSVAFYIDGEKQDVNAKIVRKFSNPKASKRDNVEFTAVEFMSADQHLKHLLNKKALEIQRRQLSQGRL
ncbi:MAG: PilZ domain-containing protein [Deltaproteobacteria bacterium]|nr:PilZ domain-containing protein [Deltaproteobacteria bacterium]